MAKAGALRRSFVSFLALLSFALALAIIIVTAVHMQNISVNLPDNMFFSTDSDKLSLNGTAQCLLGINNKHLQDVFTAVNLGTNKLGVEMELNQSLITNMNTLCVYTYITSGLGMGFAILISLLVCLGGACCGWLWAIVQVAAGILGCVSWGIAADVLMASANDANKLKALPSQNWRDSIWIMSWVQLALFGVMTLVCLGLIFAGCCGKSDKDAQEQALLEEEIKNHKPAPGERPWDAYNAGPAGALSKV